MRYAIVLAVMLSFSGCNVDWAKVENTWTVGSKVVNVLPESSTRTSVKVVGGIVEYGYGKAKEAKKDVK